MGTSVLGSGREVRERMLSSSHPRREPSLSIVIPTYNQRDLLDRCLASLIRFAPADAEILVVDDGSNDGTASHVEECWPSVRVIRLPRNSGFCTAANAGWRAAGGEIVELLNNDAEVTEGWVEEPLRCFRDPSVGAVAPLVKRLPFRNRIDSAGDEYLGYGHARKRLEGRSCSEQVLSSCEVFSASASSAFYRREAMEKVGGFPDRFGAYFDDVDLGFRLRLAGYHCLFAPTSIVYHWVSQSHSHASRQLLHQVAANSERLFWINLPARQLALMAAPYFAYLLLLMVYKGLKGEFAPWFCGKCSLLTEIPWILRLRHRSQSLVKVVPGVRKNR